MSQIGPSDMLLGSDNITMGMDNNISLLPLEIAIRNLTDTERLHLIAACGSIAGLGLLGNLSFLAYIVWNRMFKNRVSTHFIAHLLLTNMLACGYLMPIFLRNMAAGGNLYEGSGLLCRFHAFIYVTIMTVVYYMLTCIAGVHLLTFARIHYEQLFGLSPSIICAAAWVIGAALGLPCLTNSSIVEYDSRSFQCIWSDNQSSYKFSAYMILLGVILPTWLTVYAYFRMLAIMYHSPVVFEALGLFRSRYLVVFLMINACVQLPYYIISVVPSHLKETWSPVTHPACAFMAFTISLTSSFLYGISIFLMKEDDISLTIPGHKQAHMSPAISPPEV